MSTPTTPRMAKLHAPELSAEHIAEIDAILASEHSEWRPTGLPTGITFTDIFCGFGGSSICLENAGMSLVLGANHWQKAIETHALNFPDADHLIADVSNYDMRRLPRPKRAKSSTVSNSWRNCSPNRSGHNSTG
jgi:DNA (cytosine-5)-methyltransferase 1